MSDTKKNAIEQRLDHIEALWNAFADKPDARLCRWLVSIDERRMIDVFLEVQNDESGSVPDLFIRFEEPFVDPAKYGLTLAESLQAKYDEIRDSLREDGMASDWRRPAPISSTSSPSRARIRARKSPCWCSPPPPRPRSRWPMRSPAS